MVKCGTDKSGDQPVAFLQSQMSAHLMCWSPYWVYRGRARPQ